MTPNDLVSYYANLLILQYLQKPKAYATVQTVATPAIFPQTSVQALTFSGVAASGSFVLNYTPFAKTTPLTTAAINWNDSAATIQTKLQAVTGLGSVTVSGSIAAGLSITFTGVQPVVALLTVTLNTLATAGAVAITIAISQTDLTLPIAMQNAFNINSALGPVAVGAQLIPLGKYAGVTRSVSLSTGVISLTDADFLTLIQFAILKNNAGSDLKTIQSLLFKSFPNNILVFDYQNMQMSYLISSAIGTKNLAQALVKQNLLMRPMGVALASVIYAPIITTFFGFRTYLLPAFNSSPFNTYTSYSLTAPWLSYANAISV